MEAIDIQTAKARHEAAIADEARLRADLADTETRIVDATRKVELLAAEADTVRERRGSLLADGFNAAKETGRLRQLQIDAELVEDLLAGLRKRKVRLEAEAAESAKVVLAARGDVLAAEARAAATAFNEAAAVLGERAAEVWRLKAEIGSLAAQGGPRLFLGPNIGGLMVEEEQILNVPRLYTKSDRPSGRFNPNRDAFFWIVYGGKTKGTALEGGKGAE